MSTAPEFGAPRPPLPEAIREIEGHDPAMELVHYATWMSMEEGGFIKPVQVTSDRARSAWPVRIAQPSWTLDGCI